VGLLGILLGLALLIAFAFSRMERPASLHPLPLAVVLCVNLIMSLRVSPDGCCLGICVFSHSAGVYIELRRITTTARIRSVP
jgi:hypothetical protein